MQALPKPDTAAGLPCRKQHLFTRAALCAAYQRADEGAAMKKNNHKNISPEGSLSLSRALLSAAVILASFLIPLLAYSADVTLAWNANDEPDLDGYKLYYGTSSRNYTASVDAGNTTEYTLTGLTEGTTYYFAATAYDSSDNESGYSTEVVYTIGTSNHAPETPTRPTGPTSGYIQTNYSYSTSATDPDGDDLVYRFDWGDGTQSSWGAATRSHSWSSTGSFCVKARAKDEYDELSGWSACRAISISVITHTITASAGSNGSISPSGAVNVNQGDNQAFSISPDQNHHVDDVVVDGSSIGAVTSYTFVNLAGNHTITASFALDNQPPTANAGPNQTVTEGTPVTLNGSNSTDIGGSIVDYEWEQTAGIPVTLTNSDSAQATFTAPNVSFAGETLTFRLTVTDNGGLQDVDYCPISVTKEPVADSDGDGVPDGEDAFPFDPDEWLDTDNDGIGNNADDDDDNDGMPDDWEIQYGLDPLQDDADEDPDGDGVSNSDEYNAGTDPTRDDYNSVPERPVILTPENNDVVSMTPEFQAIEFYDADSGDWHQKSQWQIFDELSDTRVFDTQTSSSLTALAVPKLILDENTGYYVKVRYFDNLGGASEWSPPVMFMTDINAEDADGNGIPDYQELEGPTDMDGDGTTDSEQDDIKCLSAEGQTTYVGISVKDSPTVLAIDSVLSEDSAALLAHSNAGNKPDSLPFSMIHFKLLLKAPGDEALVTVYLSEETPQDSKVYKYDPIEDIWQNYSDHAQISPSGRSFTLTLKDGGFGDADGTENGIIVDPSGIVAAAASTPNASIDDDDEFDNDLEEFLDGLNISCFIATAADQSVNPQPSDIWREIRGRELAILFVMLLLFFAGKAAAMKIRRNRRFVKID
jgi:hypothetical protein